jgi:hypothetical protein
MSRLRVSFRSRAGPEFAFDRSRKPARSSEALAVHTVLFVAVNYVDCHHAPVTHCLMPSAIRVCRGASAAMRIQLAQVILGSRKRRPRARRVRQRQRMIVVRVDMSAVKARRTSQHSARCGGGLKIQPLTYFRQQGIEFSSCQPTSVRHAVGRNRPAFDVGSTANAGET